MTFKLIHSAVYIRCAGLRVGMLANLLCCVVAYGLLGVCAWVNIAYVHRAKPVDIASHLRISWRLLYLCPIAYQPRTNSQFRHMAFKVCLRRLQTLLIWVIVYHQNKKIIRLAKRLGQREGQHSPMELLSRYIHYSY